MRLLLWRQTASTCFWKTMRGIGDAGSGEFAVTVSFGDTVLRLWRAEILASKKTRVRNHVTLAQKRETVTYIWG